LQLTSKERDRQNGIFLGQIFGVFCIIEALGVEKFTHTQPGSNTFLLSYCVLMVPPFPPPCISIPPPFRGGGAWGRPLRGVCIMPPAALYERHSSERVPGRGPNPPAVGWGEGATRMPSPFSDDGVRCELVTKGIRQPIGPSAPLRPTPSLPGPRGEGPGAVQERGRVPVLPPGPLPEGPDGRRAGPRPG